MQEITEPPPPPPQFAGSFLKGSGRGSFRGRWLAGCERLAPSPFPSLPCSLTAMSPKHLTDLELIKQTPCIQSLWTRRPHTERRWPSVPIHRGLWVVWDRKTPPCVFNLAPFLMRSAFVNFLPLFLSLQMLYNALIYHEFPTQWLSTAWYIGFSSRFLLKSHRPIGWARLSPVTQWRAGSDEYCSTHSSA